MKRFFFVLPAILLLASSCKKDFASRELKDTATLSALESKAPAPVTTAGYQLLSFTVKKGQNVKSSYCDTYTVNISWTATGETNITGYDLEKSSTSNFSALWPLGNFPGSNSDASVTRNFADHATTNGKTISYYYRLKIYHTNGSISYSSTQSASVRTGRCLFQ